MNIVMALDYGIKKMGMAIGNDLTKDAQPLDVLAMNNGQPDWDNLLGIIITWGVRVVVVGLPKNADGSQNMLCLRAKKFARRLRHRLQEQGHHAVFVLVNEHLSSYDARDMLKSRHIKPKNHRAIDAYAACLLLSSYFLGDFEALAHE